MIPRFTRLVLTLAGAFVALACGDDPHRLGGLEYDISSLDPEALRIGLCRRGAHLELIDDMEDEDAAIELVQGRAGVWFSFNDESSDTQFPPFPPGAERFRMSPTNPPRASSSFSARTTGHGFTSWGAGIGLELLVQKPYNAKAYAGIAFWGRADKDSIRTVRVNVPDRHSSPYGNECNELNEECHEHFGKEVELSEGWQYFQIPWSQLSQPTWAKRLLTSVTHSAIYQIAFQLEGDAPFDFSIDDVAFLCPRR